MRLNLKYQEKSELRNNSLYIVTQNVKTPASFNHKSQYDLHNHRVIHYYTISSTSCSNNNETYIKLKDKDFITYIGTEGASIILNLFNVSYAI